MAKITMWVDEEPILGPHRPPFCIEGPESHAWQLTIEEGNLTLTSGCTLCDQGIHDVYDTHEFELQDAIPVRLECMVENEGTDMVYPWVSLTPVTG